MKNRLSRLSAVAAVMTSFLLSAASALSAPTYDQLFPYYIESCAETQLVHASGEKGGLGGHAVLYIKGVCRNEYAPLPQLKLCDDSMDITDPDTGVGVSVNKEFSNINFQIIPKKSFFFYGNYKGGKLTQAVEDETVESAKNYFQNVGLHEKYLEALPSNATPEQRLSYLSKHSVNTDYALAFARNSSCARIPIKKEMLLPLIQYINALNAKYFFGLEKYNWGGLTNNCTHLTHNGVASLGFYPFVPTDKPVVHGILRADIEAPANEFVAVMDLVNDRSLDVISLFNDPLIRETFMKYDWLPVREGGLLDFIPGIGNNALYKVNSNILFPPGCLTSQFCDEIFPRIRWEYMHRDKRYTNLRANLKHFEHRYRLALMKKLPADSLLYLPLVQPDEYQEFKLFHDRYFDYIARELYTVRAMEKALTSKRP